MSVRVQCPHCRSVCQIQTQLLGTAVKCGKCGQAFALPPAAQAPAPVPSPSPTPAVVKPAAQPAVAAAPGAPAAGGFWGGLRELWRSATAPAVNRPSSEEEISLELDGPAAAAVAAAPTPAAPAITAGTCRLDIAVATSAGRVRARNEDSCLIVQWTATNLDQRRDAALVIVADGMGGYEAGDQASSLVIRTAGGALLGQLAPLLAVQGQEAAPAGLAAAIATAIKTANRTVFEKGQTVPGCKGMGATAAVVVLWEGKAVIGHVGDCRVYHLHDGKLTQVTKDQTLVQRMVEMGKLTEEEALTHPNRNEVTQAVGKSADIHPASYECKLARGDWLVVACDGLHAHVDANALTDTAFGGPPAASALANSLVELANQGGGSDNCTVVAVRCY